MGIHIQRRADPPCPSGKYYIECPSSINDFAGCCSKNPCRSEYGCLDNAVFMDPSLLGTMTLSQTTLLPRQRTRASTSIEEESTIQSEETTQSGETTQSEEEEPMSRTITDSGTTRTVPNPNRVTVTRHTLIVTDKTPDPTLESSAFSSSDAEPTTLPSSGNTTSAAPAQTSTAESSSGDDGAESPSTGVIVGAAVGGLVVFALIALLVTAILRRRKLNREQYETGDGPDISGEKNYLHQTVSPHSTVTRASRDPFAPFGGRVDKTDDPFRPPSGTFEMDGTSTVPVELPAVKFTDAKDDPHPSSHPPGPQDTTTPYAYPPQAAGPADPRANLNASTDERLQKTSATTMPSQLESQSQDFLPLGTESTQSHHESFSETGFQEDAGAAPKRLIVCCDGTWQSSVSGLKNVPSNVTRLARSLARSGRDKDGKLWQQIVHYDAGIGTGDLAQDEQNRQGGLGVGFVGNVIEAYNFLVLNYNIGDEVFCFGFSRGAYTARAVAGLVNDIGIVCPKDLQDFPDLYALYQKNPDGLHFRKSQAYREWVHGVPEKNQSGKTNGNSKQTQWDKPPHHDAPEASRVVKIVGVFDTVGSLGIPDLPWTRFNLKFLEKAFGITDPGFHNISLSPYIKHAFHALALDEHRGPFSPTLWHFPTNDDQCPPKPDKDLGELWADCKAAHLKPNAPSKELADAWGAVVDGEMHKQLQGSKSELLQVWFPGMHINIGGGSDDLLTDKKGDFEQIALISFAWMCEQVAPYLQLSELGNLHALGQSAVEDRYNLLKPLLEDIRNGEEKDFGSGPLTSRISATLDRTGLKKADVRKISDEAISGWATGPIVDSFTGVMIAAGSVDRTPGRYEKDKKGSDLGKTYEMIHPCVRYRMNKMSSYKPKALSGFSRAAEGEGYVWKKGSVTIPEFLIKPEDGFTRHVAMQDRGVNGNAEAFIAEIDKFVGAAAV
ncbi:hypothetical protein FZEAL_8883 [Fusarium zealandicum]|uniref:T6SS Phospholipase effector Tle1-like catalytic domain-containing protein n=1 Tax=Fusarium zealandicum TaxID=1053134 RepID=A0A8H4UD14_9HYPO|nr:hypothetical protein FZEAL_8883 [Fusarium zealandicum]